MLGLMPGTERQRDNTEIGTGEEHQDGRASVQAATRVNAEQTSGFAASAFGRRLPRDPPDQAGSLQDRDAVDTLPSQPESDSQAVLPTPGDQHIMYGVPIPVADRSDPRAVGIIEQRQFTACTARQSFKRGDTRSQCVACSSELAPVALARKRRTSRHDASLARALPSAVPP